MPELPEVETIRTDLNKKVINKKITAVLVRKKNMVEGSVARFKKELKGNKIRKFSRIGKLMYAELQSGKYLLVHLKMTGQLIYQQGKKITAGGHGWPEVELLPNKFSHIIITFFDKSQLFFNDVRQFGYMKLVVKKELAVIIKRFGIEPLQPEFTLEDFIKILKGRKVAIKTALLNQQLIAGIGNIYADEICFAAGVKPGRKATRVKLDEFRKLYQQTQKIIKLAIDKRGTTFNDYVDTEGKTGNFKKLLKVYGREDLPCKKCKTPISKTKINGRGTHYCSVCQK